MIDCLPIFNHLPLLRYFNFPHEDRIEVESDNEENIEEYTAEDLGSTNWKLDLDHLRNMQRDDAQANIKKEQCGQKKDYDKEVQANR